jgi:amino acid transporter
VQTTRQTAVPGAPPPHGLASKLKRVFVGSPMATSQLVHERLGKATALAVFASDNLSSSAYATEEIMRVLLVITAVGAVGFNFVVPITIALLAVLAILLFSYRQTIKAYPQAGGAYLVTRDNFGLLPAQVAGVALLTDYILTVSVSVAAGTAALTSASPSLFQWRVHISVAFILLIAWGNLRGVRESGRMFAVPTYFFITMMGILLGVGFFRLFTGGLEAVETFELPKQMNQLTLFIVLKAFASGGAAVTGVEAISNGVPAFKAPEWRNARTTLMWMGTLLGAMFLGLSILARHLHVVPDPEEKVTVLAQIGRGIFGTSAAGHAFFTMLQIGTLLILVLAANTSYADFPRLASFHAGDKFLPTQLTRYGDRLVFSNGIVVLSGFAILLVVIFQASVTRLIPLYAIGVFTSFTFSQAGMARRHTKLKEPRWRQGLVINGFGAVVTLIMTVIIAATKFADGAYVILIAVPVMLFLLINVNRHYKEVGRALRDQAGRRAPAQTNHVVLLVGRPSAEEKRAFVYADRIGTEQIRCVHFAIPGEPAGAEAAWARELGLLATSPMLEVVEGRGPLFRDVRTYVNDLRARIPPDDFVTVILGERVGRRWLGRFGKPRALLVKTALLFTRGVVVTSVPYLTQAPQPILETGRPVRHAVVALVSGVHNATLRALDYARLLSSDELHVVHVAIDHEGTEKIERDWEEWDPGYSLEILESPYRSLTDPIQSYVRELSADGNTIVTVLLPEFVVQKWWHHALHNQSGLALKRLFLAEPNLIVTSVPYHLVKPARQKSLTR